MTTTVTIWHRVKVQSTRWGNAWRTACLDQDCFWSGLHVGRTGYDAWQTAVGKALAHVDDTKEQT